MKHHHHDDGPELIDLMQELLDAHLDTIEMAADLPADADWASHADYLQRLRQAACGVLARRTWQSRHAA
jgi:hypothetical protein